MNAKTLNVIDQTDNQLAIELLCSFRLPELARDYIVYTLNEVDENDMLKVYSAILQKVDREYYIRDIASEDDWNKVKDILKTIAKENKGGNATEYKFPFGSVPIDLLALNEAVVKKEDTYGRVVKVSKVFVDALKRGYSSTNRVTFSEVISNANLDRTADSTLSSDTRTLNATSREVSRPLVTGLVGEAPMPAERPKEEEPVINEPIVEPVKEEIVIEATIEPEIKEEPKIMDVFAKPEEEEAPSGEGKTLDPGAAQYYRGDTDAESNAILGELQKELTSFNKIIGLITTKVSSLDIRDANITKKEVTLDAREKTINKKEIEFGQKEDRLSILELQIQQKDEELKRVKKEVSTREVEVFTKENLINAKILEINEKERQVSMFDAEKARISEQLSLLESKEIELNTLEKQMQRRQANLDEAETRFKSIVDDFNAGSRVLENVLPKNVARKAIKATEEEI